MARAKLKVVPSETDAKSYTVNGEHFTISDMTGRDYLLIRGIQIAQKVTDIELRAILDMMNARCVASSVPILDLPVARIMSVMWAWFAGTSDDALPPAIAST